VGHAGQDGGVPHIQKYGENMGMLLKITKFFGAPQVIFAIL
jgi:hypothetical protein